MAGIEKPVLILVGGINGAGKTTLYYNQIKPYLDSRNITIPFVNADELEAASYPNEIGQHSMEMGERAAQIRTQYLKAKQSFVTETVFSHESKNQLITDAQKADFNVVLNHVHVDSPELAYMRVRSRVSRGGHAVPKDKVFARYERTISNIQSACLQADKTFVWHNSTARQHNLLVHRFVMSMTRGRITKLADSIPDWARVMYAEQIGLYQVENLTED